ncbi:putative flagellar protein FliS, partial [Necator americanus]
DTRRCPYFATLSLLLSSGNRKHIDDLVEASALQKLPTSERGNMCLRTQMSDLILCYFSSLYNRCSQRQMEVFVDFVLLHGFEMAKISNVIEELMHCIDKMANDVPAYQLMANSIMRLLLKHMFATNSEPFLDDYLDFLRNIQLCKADEKKSSEHLKNIAHFLDHVVKNKWASAFSVSPAVKSLVSAFFGLPLQFSSEPSRGYYL